MDHGTDGMHTRLLPDSGAEEGEGRNPRGEPREVPAFRIGAGNGIRTRDPQLGKLMLYQLSYSRVPTRFLP